LEAELFRSDGVGTGIKVTVEGESVNTQGPVTHFVPVVVAPLQDIRKTALQQRSDALAKASREEIPDYYPLPQNQGSFPTVPQPLQDYSFLPELVDSDWTRWLPNLFGDPFKDVRDNRRALLVAALESDIKAGALLAGADRVVVMVDRDQYGTIAPGDSFAASKKLVIVPWNAESEFVAHELAHTMPFVWSASQMSGQCGLDYHNKVMKPAHGFRITFGGSESREPKLKERSITSKSGATEVSPPLWITQCTYWNLVKELQKKQDPELLLVRGRIARSGDLAIGELFPAYQMKGFSDPVFPASNDWAIVTWSESGAELGRFPFAPEWTSSYHGEGDQETPVDRGILSFAHRVPALPGVAQIDLEGPTGLLDSQRFSANAPIVTITSPKSDAQAKANDGNVEVEWDGNDPDGDELLYSTFYSSDGGETWHVGTFEQTESVHQIGVDLEVSQHLVKVIATDGVRSTEALVEFTLASDSGAAGDDEQGGGMCSAPSGHVGKLDLGLPAILLLLGGLVMVGRWPRLRD
jgi:hypothetical protein